MNPAGGRIPRVAPKGAGKGRSTMVGYAVAFVAGAILAGTATGHKVARVALGVAILALAVVGALALIPR